MGVLGWWVHGGWNLGFDSKNKEEKIKMKIKIWMRALCTR